MRRVLIVQARTTSQRLPGKVLLELAGRPMLSQQLGRLRRCRRVDELRIATTVNPNDDPIAALAAREGLPCFRGSEQDVLGRFTAAAREAGADVVARVTADCPLIDPETVDRVVEELSSHAAACDYVSNVMPRSFPRGLDVEALFWDTLLRMDRMARSGPAREHVTVFLRSERPELFVRRNVADEQDNSDLRWTVDTAEDLAFVRTLYGTLELDRRPVHYREILAHVRAHPALARRDAQGATWDPS